MLTKKHIRVMKQSKVKVLRWLYQKKYDTDFNKKLKWVGCNLIREGLNITDLHLCSAMAKSTISRTLKHLQILELVDQTDIGDMKCWIITELGEVTLKDWASNLVASLNLRIEI